MEIFYLDFLFIVLKKIFYRLFITFKLTHIRQMIYICLNPYLKNQSSFTSSVFPYHFSFTLHSPFNFFTQKIVNFAPPPNNNFPSVARNGTY